MSVLRVTIQPSDDNYAPPTQEIELAVIGNDVFITVYEGSLDDLSKGRTEKQEVPPIALKDLNAALAAFGDFHSGLRFERPLLPASTTERNPNG